MKPIALPERVTLPSGRQLLLRRGGRRAHAAASKSLFSRAIDAFDSGAVTVADGRGAPLDVRDLALGDFHALRAIAARTGDLDEEAIEIACKNCQKPWTLAPCETFELGPFEHGELHDDELDRTLETGAPHAVGPWDDVRFAPLTLGRALPLHEALAKPRWTVTSSVVLAMGLVRLGEAKTPKSIARTLARCDDDAFDALTDAFLATHYPPRLFARHECPACGARNDVDAPYDREFQPGARSEGASAPFADEDAFDAHARKAAKTWLEGAPEVELVIDLGTPACDDGGEPLLGAYVPAYEGDAHTPSAPPRVTLYYRTFRAMWQEDGEYDWRAEIDETLEHEMEHHRSALRGHDETDLEERDEIAREALRVVGKREIARRATKGLAADFGEFLRRTWVIWIVALIALILTIVAGK